MITEKQEDEPYINTKILYDFEGPSILRHSILCPATNIIVVNNNNNLPSLAKDTVSDNNNVTLPAHPAPYISKQTIRRFVKMSPKSFKHKETKPEPFTNKLMVCFLRL